MSIEVPESTRKIRKIGDGTISELHKSGVSAAGGVSNNFNISVGVHQSSALSPLLFNLVMDEATRECRRGLPWDILYADDLVLMAESMDEVVLQFER